MTSTAFSHEPYVKRLKEEFPRCTIRIENSPNFVGYWVIDEDGKEWGIEQSAEHWDKFLKAVEYLKNLMRTKKHVL